MDGLRTVRVVGVMIIPSHKLCTCLFAAPVSKCFRRPFIKSSSDASLLYSAQNIRIDHTVCVLYIYIIYRFSLKT